MHDAEPDHATARIGPNALTQLFDPIRTHYGADVLKQMLGSAGITQLPSMTGLIDEAPVIRFHALLHETKAENAKMIEREAGIGTARYVLANRIPKPVQVALKVLPPSLSAILLTRAIAKNAWTFTGSGGFEVISKRPLILQVTKNPLIRGVEKPSCDWHAAVFETLFQTLVSKKTRIHELCCSATKQNGCQFRVDF